MGRGTECIGRGKGESVSRVGAPPQTCLDALERVAVLLHALDAKRVVDGADADNEDVIAHLEAGLKDKNTRTMLVGAKEAPELGLGGGANF